MLERFRCSAELCRAEHALLTARSCAISRSAMFKYSVFSWVRSLVFPVHDRSVLGGRSLGSARFRNSVRFVIALGLVLALVPGSAQFCTGTRFVLVFGLSLYSAHGIGGFTVRFDLTMKYLVSLSGRSLIVFGHFFSLIFYGSFSPVLREVRSCSVSTIYRASGLVRIKRKEPLYQLEENRSDNRPTIRKLLLSQDQAEYLANLKRVCSDYRHTIREPLLSQDQAREQ
ncbi:hypothetical protein LR48_Vigan11g074000 [Vigna angularis]|uniref:Uncharacterized protein n=1 Tax=Phaseolus angularis TaxID=3914 RepID=A0A0L9VS58_PHAAN|nr:hypothetical protein LR48_Vigan11g074000 [Vigna angularis]